MVNRSRARALVTAVVVLAVVVAAGCGGGEGPTLDAATTTQPPQTTAPPVTTIAPAPEGPAAPLTGVAATGPEVLTRPAIIAKIDNSDGSGCLNTSRPHAGINQADIVFEIWVEGITRFAAVFHSTLPEVIGPVRSARSSDVDIIPAFRRPLFAWSGANDLVASELRRVGQFYVDVGHGSSWGSRYFRETNGRCAPHNLMLNPSEVYEAEGGEPPQPVFTYRAKGAALPAGQGVATDGVKLTTGQPVEWRWNRLAKLWERTQNGSPHVDTEGVQINAENVLVLVTQYKNSSTPGSPQALSVGKGRALVYTDGKVVEGEWARSFAAAPWVLTDNDGKPIELTRGTTWVSFSLADKAQDLSTLIGA